MRSSLFSGFPFLCYGLLLFALFLALIVFLYGSMLNSEQLDTDAQLAQAQAQIDPQTIESFIRLRDRLASGTRLLDGHPAFTIFFDALEAQLPATTRFTALHVAFDPNNVAKLEAAGVAKSFNALAATSETFAKDGRIKNAIFSNISVNKDNSVSFSLTASLDPKLTAFTLAAPRSTTPVQPASTTPTTAPKNP